MKYAAVIVETRILENFGQILFDHMSRLPESFQLYVFHGNDNYHHVDREVNRYESLMYDALGERYSAYFVFLINIESEGFEVKDQNTYNTLLTSCWFWDQIDADQVLIFQPDSRILSKDRNAIEKFYKWDYVGSPWKFQEHGGNGGISWRTVWEMKRIIRDNPYSPVLGNEDVYFCNIMKEQNRGLAPREVCRQFGVESIFEMGTFCSHAIEKYLSPPECNAILSQYT